jgi:hypothetical protein
MSDPVSTAAPQEPSTQSARPAAAKTGRRWKIIVPVAAAVVIAAAGGGAYAYHHEHAKPNAKHKAGTTTTMAPKPATFSLPDTLDGLPKSTDQQTTSLASAALADLTASITDLSGTPVLGAYGSGSDTAIIVGLPATPTDADSEISNVFDALRSTQFFRIPDPTPIPTGQTGSEIQCADASLIGGVAIPVGACVETDGGGSVLLLRLTKTGAQAGDVLKATLPTFERH